MERPPSPDQVRSSSECTNPILCTDLPLTLRELVDRLDVTLLEPGKAEVGQRPAECHGITDLLREDDVLRAVLQTCGERLGNQGCVAMHVQDERECRWIANSPCHRQCLVGEAERPFGS